MSVYYKNTAIRRLIPTDINNCVLWLDAADAATVHFSSGVLVDQWDDKSGNANHATQATPANQPTYVLAEKNGKNIVLFDGISNEMILPSGVYGIPNANNTGIVVVKQTTGGISGRIITASVSGSKYALQITTGGAFRFFNNLTIDTVAQAATTTNYNIVTYYLDQPTQSISVNGASPTQDSAGLFVPGINSAFTGSFGGGEFINASIAEIILYGGALSSPEITNLEAMLSQKWAITLP